jgi:hypothetical protein
MSHITAEECRTEENPEATSIEYNPQWNVCFVLKHANFEDMKEAMKLIPHYMHMMKLVIN